MDSKNRILFSLAAMCFLTNGDIYSGAPLLISIAQDLNITTAQASLTITSYMGAFGLMNLFFGPIGDRFGRERILIISAFGTSICSCLCKFTDSFSVLVFLRALNGGFGAGILPISVALTGEIFKESAPKAIAKLMGILILGGASATIIGGGLSHFFSWKTVYFSYGFAELVISFILLMVLKYEKQAIKRIEFLEMYKKVLKNNEVLFFLLLVFMVGFSVFGSFSFAGELLAQKGGLNLFKVGAVLSLFGLGGIFSSYILNPTTGTGIKKICIIAGLSGALSLYLLPFSKSSLLSGLLLFIWGISFMSMHSNYISQAQNLIPEIRGTIMAFISFSILLGGTTGTLINKEIIEVSVIENVFKFSAFVFLMIGIYASVLLEQPTQQKSDTDLNREPV